MKISIIILMVLSCTALENGLLSQISPRRLISTIFEKLDLNNTGSEGFSQIVRITAQPNDILVLKDYLESSDHLLIENLWKRIESKRCLQGVPCKERDEVMQLYLSEEAKSLIDLEPIFRNLIDVENIDINTGSESNSHWSKAQHIFYIINIVLTPLAASIVVGNHKKWSAPIIFLLLVFMSSMIISYVKMYQDKLSARMAASASLVGDPCAPPKWYEQIGMTIKGLVSLEEKSSCRRFIESQTGSAFFDVSPTAVLMDVVSHLILGWLGPLGRHLNHFWKELFHGVPILGQIVVLGIGILVSVLVAYVILGNLSFEGVKKFIDFMKLPFQRTNFHEFSTPAPFVKAPKKIVIEENPRVFTVPSCTEAVPYNLRPRRGTPKPETGKNKRNQCIMDIC